MTADDRPDSVGTFKAFAIAEGILLIILGVLALIFPVIASVWVTGSDRRCLSRWRRGGLDQQSGPLQTHGALDLLLAISGFNLIHRCGCFDDQQFPKSCRGCRSRSQRCR